MEKCFLQIGEFYATKKPMLLGTLLGSCVSICLYNKFNGHAAMNHFVIPSANKKEMKKDPGKYGKSSCEMIIRTLMDVDPDSSHYTAQVFGGGNVFNFVNTTVDIGERNIFSAEQVLAKYKLRVIHRETGGTKGRTIYFYTAKNRVECRNIVGLKHGKRIQTQYEKAFWR